MTRLRYRSAINEALREELERDPAVMLLGEDIREPWGGTFKVTEGLSTTFGDDRVLNTPIAENGIVGVALGAALCGLRPVLELMFLDFSLLAMDQIANQVAKIRYMTGGQVRVPLVIRAPGGGYKNAAAQHSQSLEALFAHIPGLLVAVPSTPADAKGLLKTAIRLDDPVMYIEHKSLYMDVGEVPDGEHLVPFGVADIKRPGSDVTIVAWSRMVALSLWAAEQLAMEGIEAEVLDPRTLVPLDEAAILASVARTGRLVVIGEAPKRGGYQAEIAAMVAERGAHLLRSPIVRVGAANTPIPMAPALEKVVLPQVESIVRAVRRCVTDAVTVRGSELVV
jgi:acetoin:2,6-dichlorophenolindophenol oxidoreductase subunit beta